MKTIKDEAKVEGSKRKKRRGNYEEEVQGWIDGGVVLWLITLNDRHKTFLILND